MNISNVFFCYLIGFYFEKFLNAGWIELVVIAQRCLTFILQNVVQKFTRAGCFHIYLLEVESFSVLSLTLKVSLCELIL